MARKRRGKPIHEAIRKRRVEVLHIGLREMARRLGISAPYLTDLEHNKRVPADDLLIKMAKHYDIDEAELRAGWNRPEPVVGEVASQDATTAAKVPEFLRTARDLSPQQWDKLIKQAKRMTSEE